MNIQPIEKRVLRDDGFVTVHSIFKTIQGEGPFCGVPCVFVRLAGCNLQCPACDTDYTSTRKLMGPYEVLAAVNELWRADGWRTGLVVVTGGKPFRQDLKELLTALTTNNYDVQIESNGTLAPSSFFYHPYVTNVAHKCQPTGGAYIVCSPKTGKVHPDISKAACALKYVVESGYVNTDGLPLSALRHTGRPARPPEGWDRPIYVQPLDDKDPDANAAHTAQAVDSCFRHGYTLQIQIHKVIGVE